MPITGVTEEQYKDAKDIDSTGGFENAALIKPYLESGFELKPSPIIEAPENAAALFLYGGSWTRVITHTYPRGGSIVYRKLPSGRYEAKVRAPIR
jgi:hypothetical protein